MPSAEVNLTAHVSLDAVRAAGESAGLRTVLDCRQEGGDGPAAGRSPPNADPLSELSRRSERAALASPYGWGTHRWLIQSISNLRTQLS